MTLDARTRIAKSDLNISAPFRLSHHGVVYKQRTQLIPELASQEPQTSQEQDVS